MQVRFGYRDDTGRKTVLWLAVEIGERLFYMEAK